MFSSVPLMSVFSVLFLVTGVYAVVRLAALASGVHASVDRAAELSHVVMSVAMIAMAWGWSGGPSSPSGVLQVVFFGLVGLYFLIGAVRGHRALPASGYHLVMALAMVWMVATMPLLMGAAGSSGAAMEGMPWMTSGGSGATGPADPGAHPWVLPVSLVLVVLLLAAGVFWAARAARAARGPVGSLLSPRADAACHAFMSAGMAWMLAAML
ncbi:MAG TPA: DUF5134 domain-containing protein [Pseudonocardia sp.]|nr:DUF5134 domain-containing protein [Pseudonocardia sp.]